MSVTETRTAITLVQNGDERLPVNVLLGEITQIIGEDLTEVHELGEGAVDVILGGGARDTGQLQRVLLARLPQHVDICVQPTSGREKRLLLCDMDSTVIGQECIDELADYAGIKTKIAAITERAMRGELDFEEALTERVALLSGLAVTAMETCFQERITLTPGARTLVQTMTARGASCQLVSGGFTFFTARVAEAAGFSDHFANVLIDDGDKLTGDVQRPILGKQAKLERLNATLSDLGLEPSQSLCIGDGANDSAMIEAAGMGIGFNPHPVLAESASAVISGPSLTTALYFQGIQQSDWILD